MDKEKIKNGLTNYIGSDHLFTPEMKSKILMQTKTPKIKKSRFPVKRVASVFVVAIAFIGFMLYFSEAYHFDTNSGRSMDKADDTHSDISATNEESSLYQFGKLDEDNTEQAEMESLEENLTMDMPEESLGELKRKGFTGNLDDIKQNLIAHPEIIPYDGVLGGTMKFQSEETIKILSHEWVFAPFDDGHVSGFLLLKYTISNGEIEKWEVIDSYLFQ